MICIHRALLRRYVPKRFDFVMGAGVHAGTGAVGNGFTKEILKSSYIAYGAILLLKLCITDRHPRLDTDL
jgi:hypothetical protein